MVLQSIVKLHEKGGVVYLSVGFNGFLRYYTRTVIYDKKNDTIFFADTGALVENCFVHTILAFLSSGHTYHNYSTGKLNMV